MKRTALALLLAAISSAALAQNATIRTDRVDIGGSATSSDIRSYTDAGQQNAGWLMSKEKFRGTPVFVGQLGNPEANFAFNFGYEGNSHHLYDETQNGWSFSLTNERAVLQFIPAGSNQPYGPLDIWYRTGSEPWFIHGPTGNMTVTGRGYFGAVGDQLRLKVDGTNAKDATLHADVNGRIRLGPWAGGGVSVETDGNVAVAAGLRTGGTGPAWRFGGASTATVVPDSKIILEIEGVVYELVARRVQP